jgi:hypothetical protein
VGAGDSEQGLAGLMMEVHGHGQQG